MGVAARLYFGSARVPFGVVNCLLCPLVRPLSLLESALKCALRCACCGCDWGCLCPSVNHLYLGYGALAEAPTSAS